MRRHNFPDHDPSARANWSTIRTLLPYLLEFKGRVVLAVVLLVLAKLANVAVPLALKEIVDVMNHPQAALAVPVALVVAYGLLRLFSTLFGELRDAVFAKVTQRAIRQVALQVFTHLHSLSLRFHLDRQTGGISRDIERGTKGISFLLTFLLFNILPTLLEIALVALILFSKYSVWFAVITFATLLVYIVYTLAITEWRMVFRREMNEMDSKANTRAIDSLINYETVKYFGNEQFEARRFDEHMEKWETSAVQNQTSLATLNAGQSGIIALGVTGLMLLAAHEVVQGRMTLGDLVLVNVFMLQLYLPMHFLGFVYREIKSSLIDMEKMFSLLHENREVQDAPGAMPISISSGAVRFEQVAFSYEADRKILTDVSFDIPPGHIVAVVGSSGAGKSTLSRLLFRFYDVQSGRILVDGQDIREVTQASLRAAIGIVPQDTVLFNDSIYYNIAYGRPDASHEEILQAAQAAHIHDFIVSLPKGYDTVVGERGLKLSGGEKQRVAIARAILKRPSILIFDEATSALDSKSEKAIQAELRHVSRDRTTLVIAHRLSTIVDAQQILVMDQGRVVERGTHRELLAQQGLYAQMWALQQQEEL
ncbi:MAG: metal ABC transporter permease [Gallionellales bacterium 35-53-114]|jgi:ATP-binding cassette subfamily B protein|nr:MAG: metal ABC transporter permease [Gallionellales bacterium 35-53-114]OYZ63262.1 MAG: metal ABC transporter permease [Gallionellales bacterium 24-53-125]OZB08724.1 MAG: metal ABC transporter permease [Gallionellales bacterium 39-52-133]HQS57404.1 ABC transporter ATP-binding protein/permease [Gallionellaceae bacterium]HQS74408.1 ABC transporter ATP-binding protein/permease [Gallionellaceae bacterium]